MGATIIFNVGRKDAQWLADSLRGQVSIDRLTNLKPRQAVLRAGGNIVGFTTSERRGDEDPAIRERVISESRRRYYKPAHELRTTSRGRLPPIPVTGAPGSLPPLATAPQTREIEFEYDVFQ